MKPADLLRPSTVTVLVSALTSIVVFVSLTLLTPYMRSWLMPGTVASGSSKTDSIKLPDKPIPNAESEDRITIDVVKQVQPAIVAVLVTVPSSLSRNNDGVYGIDMFDPFAPSSSSDEGTSKDKTQVAGGSGFFVTADGLLVTNRHVVDFDKAEYTIMTHDGRKYSAKILAEDPVLDIAFLQVEGSGFPHLEMADSDKIVPGQTVIAIGNALGEFRNTITKGIVSGLNRRLIAGDGIESEIIEEAIQTDAAINPGNSGGPLLDLTGKVIGLNTAVSDQGQLLGFALPSNSVSRDLESIRLHGKILRAFLGIRYQPVTEQLVEKNQLKVDYGALIVRGTDSDELAVMPGSPADKAGLVENDILLELDGVKIDDEHSLSTLIGKHVPGDETTIKYLHGGETKTATVKLEELKTGN